VVRHPRFFVIPKIFKLSDGLLMAASCLAAVRRLRHTFPFDLIDAHWAYPDGVAAALLARYLRVPMALTVRGDDINILPHQFWHRQCIRWALARAARVIALSAELRQGAIALGVPPANVAVIPNGIDPQRFHPVDRHAARDRLGLPQQERMVLSVGRLHLSKGYPVLVEALARLQEKFPDLCVVIVGAADPEANAQPLIQAVAAQYGVSQRVHLVGAQPPTTLVDWYSAADVFCLPTFREGSANVLLEALACGLPCVTTPVGGNAEVISTPEVGRLVPAEAQAVAEAIAQCLSRTWDRARLAAHIHSRTWTAVAEECYAQLSPLVRLPAGIDT
jgi:glycosyltransferase involved in cell wall biosynthesis